MKNFPDSPGKLLQRVKELELVSRHNCSALMSGTFASSIPGRGLIFHESRRYVEGDDVRSIDWNMTARLLEPYVRVFLDEREREIFIALDISNSMKSGWQKHTKISYGIEMAATLIFSAHQNRDKFGLVLFAGNVLKTLNPAGGRRHLFECLKALAEAPLYSKQETGDSDPRSACHKIESLKGRRFVIFMISDFIDDDLPDDLRYLRARHDVNLLRIYDPLERVQNDRLKLWGYSPEKRGAEPGSSIWTPVIKKKENPDPLIQAANRMRILAEDFSTAIRVPDNLMKMFHRKRKMLAS